MDDSWVLPSMVYMSPEVLKVGEHAISDDVYAFGILCYEVVTRNDPYSVGLDTPLLQILHEVSTSTVDFGSRLPLPASTNPSLSAICRDCMNLNGRMRPTFGEVERRMRSLCPAVHSPTDPGSDAGVMQGASSSGGDVAREMKLDGPGLAIAMAASEALLHKVFPAHVAEALKQGKKVYVCTQQVCVCVCACAYIQHTKCAHTNACVCIYYTDHIHMHEYMYYMSHTNRCMCLNTFPINIHAYMYIHATIHAHVCTGHIHPRVCSHVNMCRRSRKSTNA